jgi:hypothetical protein
MSTPALAAARDSFDIDADNRISEEELINGLTLMFGSQTVLTEMTCFVTFNGRPLAGATVRLRPIKMLGDALPPAEGVTDRRGSVRPTINADLLPEDFKQRPLLYPGLYHVEITHPVTQIASRYNTASVIGCMVDPAARGGTSSRFDLK